jgi:hypothetical protein
MPELKYDLLSEIELEISSDKEVTLFVSPKEKFLIYPGKESNKKKKKER